MTGLEIDPDLARKASENLKGGWPRAEISATDGFAYLASPDADAIIVNAGVSHLPLVWLDGLAAENGRLLVPLTTRDRVGGFLLITRLAGAPPRYPARCVSLTGIISCVGGRDAEAEDRLKDSLARSSFAMIRSLRRPPDEPDDTCWLAGNGWWLSTAPVPEGPASFN